MSHRRTLLSRLGCPPATRQPRRVARCPAPEDPPDLGTTKAYLEADAPRVRCPEHGVVVAAMPWARHGAGHPRMFDDTVAWLAAHTSKSAVGALTRVA